MTTETIQTFTDTFDGTVLLPADPGFAQASEVHNATHNDRRPAVIARPRSVRGVAQAVRAAQAAGLSLSVRGGGHSPAGYGAAPDGFMLDLRDLTDIDIDPVTRRVTVQPGLTWDDVARALHPHGLAITSGDVGSVGVSGLTQGGGVGWFVRREGLSIDRLRAVELVTAQGDAIRASATERPDVFWAARGAGANLGVITSLEFEAHEGGLVYGGMLGIPVTSPAEAARLMGEFARLAHLAPDSLTMQGLFMAAPPAPFVPAHLIGQTIFAVLAMYSGDPSAGESALADIRALGTAAFDLLGPLPYPAMFDFTREVAAHGYRHASRSGFLNDLTADALTELGHAVQHLQPGVVVQLRPLGGALSRVPDHATAFCHRQARYLMLTTCMVPQDLPAELDAAAWAAADQLWAPFAAHSAGLYGNFATERDADPAQAAYHAQARQRVAAVKAQLDPHNVFSRNVNVEPSAPELAPV